VEGRRGSASPFPTGPVKEESRSGSRVWEIPGTWKIESRGQHLSSQKLDGTGHAAYYGKARRARKLEKG